jgi:hypothetical protein
MRWTFLGSQITEACYRQAVAELPAEGQQVKAAVNREDAQTRPETRRRL